MKLYQNVLSGCLIFSSLICLSSCNNTKTIVFLEIIEMPDKLIYEEGETLDITELVVEATYDDGSKEIVDAELENTEPVTRLNNYMYVIYDGISLDIKITVTLKGNNEKYSLENTSTIENSPLENKTYYFLGSSVTYGVDDVSMADYIGKRNNAKIIKNAVSGTTLRGDGESYVNRLDEYLNSDSNDEIDVFVCQLSTNDMHDSSLIGNVTENNIKDKSMFYKNTTMGAIEYIIASAKEKFDCPVMFYTNSNLGKKEYKQMIDKLFSIQEKWDLKILDLYNDEEFNDITAEEKNLYMIDNTHPTLAGYREWWTPAFEEFLKNI